MKIVNCVCADAFKHKTYNLFLHCQFYSLAYRKVRKKRNKDNFSSTSNYRFSAFSEF